MEKIIEKVLKKIMENLDIIKKWTIGTTGYNGQLEIVFSGEVVDAENKKSLDFNDCVIIDEDAEMELERKLTEILEFSKSCFDAE